MRDASERSGRTPDTIKMSSERHQSISQGQETSADPRARCERRNDESGELLTAPPRVKQLSWTACSDTHRDRPPASMARSSRLQCSSLQQNIQPTSPRPRIGEKESRVLTISVAMMIVGAPTRCGGRSSNNLGWSKIGQTNLSRTSSCNPCASGLSMIVPDGWSPDRSAGPEPHFAVTACRAFRPNNKRTEFSRAGRAAAGLLGELTE
jgi:hypothetical protein